MLLNTTENKYCDVNKILIIIVANSLVIFKYYQISNMTSVQKLLECTLLPNKNSLLGNIKNENI